MQELAWAAEIVRIWLEGGTWDEIQAAPGFRALVLTAAFVVPSSLIVIGIAGWTEWRATPFAIWFGLVRDPEEGWSERARDIDKDGAPDF